MHPRLFKVSIQISVGRLRQDGTCVKLANSGVWGASPRAAGAMPLPIGWHRCGDGQAGSYNPSLPETVRAAGLMSAPCGNRAKPQADELQKGKSVEEVWQSLQGILREVNEPLHQPRP